VRLMRKDEAIWSQIWRRRPGNFRHELCRNDEMRLAKKSPQWGGRDYLQLNPCHRTLEFRAPKGSCRGSTILATVQICHAIVEYCIGHGMDHIDRTGVVGFIRWLQTRPRVETGAALAYLADPRRGALCAAPKSHHRKTDNASPAAPLAAE